MDKVEFIAMIRYIGWVNYQIAAMQDYNEEINDDQLESLMNGVMFQLVNPDVTSEESHENWIRSKYAQGWVYGPVKDFDKKTHPDIVPYDDLPEIEKLKDLSSSTSHRLALKLWERLYEGVEYE
jgi:hypothetical protein